jgi:hypothetical protein
MKELVFLLEEKSAHDFLAALWPRLVPLGAEITPRMLTFEGKRDLEKEIPRKIKGYQNPEARFLVMRDQDSGDCHPLKQRLADLCRDNASGRPFRVRIVCRELENWYLAQLSAVEKGLHKPGLAKWQNKSRYRDPDHTGDAPRELARLVGQTPAKRSWARAIAPHLDLDCDRSASFKHFVAAVRQLCAD